LIGLCLCSSLFSHSLEIPIAASLSLQETESVMPSTIAAVSSKPSRVVGLAMILNIEHQAGNRRGGSMEVENLHALTETIPIPGDTLVSP
jgi:hypothetical protein